MWKLAYMLTSTYCEFGETNETFDFALFVAICHEVRMTSVLIWRFAMCDVCLGLVVSLVCCCALVVVDGSACLRFALFFRAPLLWFLALLFCFGSWRFCFALVLGAPVLLWFLALLCGLLVRRFWGLYWTNEPNTFMVNIFLILSDPNWRILEVWAKQMTSSEFALTFGICQGITQYGLVWSCSNYVVWCYGIMRNHHQKDGTSISTTFWVPLTKWIGPKFGRTQNCSPCAITWGDLKTWSCHQKFAAGSQLLSKQDISLLGEKCWLSSQTKSPVGFLIEPQSMGMWRQIHF